MGSEHLMSLAYGHTILSTKKAHLIPVLPEQSFSPSIVEINLRKQVSNVKYALVQTSF